MYIKALFEVTASSLLIHATGGMSNARDAYYSTMNESVCMFDVFLPLVLFVGYSAAPELIPVQLDDGTG